MPTRPLAHQHELDELFDALEEGLLDTTLDTEAPSTPDEAEDEQMLARLGPRPAPAQIVALYNSRSLEAALCYAEQVRLHLRGPVWTVLRSAHNLARRYRIGYSGGRGSPHAWSSKVLSAR